MSNKKTIKVKKDPETGDGLLDLADFKDLVDISKVKSYTLEPVSDDYDIALILKFYDENDNLINCK